MGQCHPLDADRVTKGGLRMKGKKVYMLIECSWNGSNAYTFDDAYVYESEEERDKAYQCAIDTQKRLNNYNSEWLKYETEIR